MKLYTIGHSDLSLADFLGVLREHGVRWIADVRSAPFSGRYPHFNRRPLTYELKRAGIKYLYLGDKVGGKPKGADELAWSQGKLNYMLVSHLSRSSDWREGIALLERAIANEGDDYGCLLCSEANPNNCHRSLIAFELEHSINDLTVEHLTRAARRADVSFQKTLFKVSDDRSHYH